MNLLRETIKIGDMNHDIRRHPESREPKKRYMIEVLLEGTIIVSEKSRQVVPSTSCNRGFLIWYYVVVE